MEHDVKHGFVLGMDGGGTAACIMACKLDGTLIGTWKAGALNVNGQPYEKAAEAVGQAMKQLEGRGLSLKDCRGVCVGAAGISNEAAAPVIERTLRECGMTGPIRLVGDHETALAAEFDELWGVVVIAGTGSICYGMDPKGRCLRVGGYGHLIDDEGSAYAIGCGMLKAIVKSADGRGEKTRLMAAVYQLLCVNSPESLITWLYEPYRTKKEIAALAMLAEQAALAGDVVAYQILESAARELVLLAHTVLCGMPETDKILLCGSVLKKNATVRRIFTANLKEPHPGVKTVIMRKNAALGAVRIIRKELGYL